MWTSDEAYDRFMGRFSRKLAPIFADFAGIEREMVVLDVGAGTGALTAELVERGVEAAAIEPSPQFAAALRRRFPGVDVREGGAEELPWRDDSFDVALAQLVVSFMRDAPAGVREMLRVARSAAVCMWDLDGMEMLAAIKRTREELGDDPGGDARYRTRAEIAQLIGDGATIDLLEVDADYRDFEDFWNAVAGGAGPAGVWAASLDDEQRAVARAELFRQLGEPDGPFTLTGRAWAAKLTRA
ncbi:MAG: class I SAM-dependent methyltransferase [Acidobacteriota bacterium]|nr:class I SAM-dependent methyltransferase [Acidobacteriota bacterium]